VTQGTNNPPDVLLELTHEQATFMLENCLANKRLCLAMVMGIADEKISIEDKQKKAEKIVEMQEKFTELMQQLRRAGAREKE
jgi:hypothetical protein